MFANNIKKNFSLVVVILICLFINVSNSEAFTFYSGLSTGYVESGSSRVSIKRKDSVDGPLLFCAEREKGIGPTCTGTEVNLNPEVYAGLYNIIEDYNEGFHYLCTEYVINKFLYNYYKVTPGRKNSDLSKNWTTACPNATAVYNEAVAKYNSIKSLKETTISYSTSNLNFTYNSASDKYEATTTLNTGGYGFECTTNTNGVSISERNNVVTVSASKSLSGQTITLSCRVKATYMKPTYYDCGNIQDLVTQSATPDYVTGPFSEISGSFNDVSTLTIYKRNSVSNNLITSSSSTFYIHYGENCPSNAIGTLDPIYGEDPNIYTTVSTGNSGMASVALEPGTYSIYEKTVPKGYVDPYPKCVVNSFTITSGESKSINIYNTPDCSNELSSLGTNPSVNQLLSLYKKYPGNTNLLNFEDPSCSVATNCNNNFDVECLSANRALSTTFNENNLSCYDESIQDSQGNYTTFCINTYELKNPFNTNDFYGYAGQFLIKRLSNTEYDGSPLDVRIYDDVYNSKIVKVDNIYSGLGNNDAKFLTGQRDIICYSIDSDFKINAEEITQKINVYFGDNDDNDVVDELNYSSLIINSGEDGDDTTNIFKEYIYTEHYTYELNPIYLQKMTGKYSFVSNTNTLDNPIYGILIPFKTNDTGSLTFKVKYDGKEYYPNSEKTCKYYINKELIEYPNDNGELQLEFRTIDTNTPFTRDTNSNWCSDNSCDYDNDTVQSIIKDSNNSYNRTQEGSLYTNDTTSTKTRIILTPTLIQDIRKYNDAHPYDDYELSCDNSGQNCENAFLKEFNITKTN